MRMMRIRMKNRDVQINSKMYAFLLYVESEQLKVNTLSVTHFLNDFS